MSDVTRILLQAAVAQIRAKLDKQVDEWMRADPDTATIALGRSEGLADALGILSGRGEGTAEWAAATDRYVERQRDGE
jgi:hypothetical protein